MKTITINNLNYQLISNYQQDALLRQQLNVLTQRIFGFTFEDWYQKGYWKDHCIPYSLVLKDKIVAHVTVSIINFVQLGKDIKTVQLGTVLTHEDYRHLGLSRVLIEEIIKEWQMQCDFIYLYGNDDVVDFYPRFGFQEVKEYQVFMQPKERKEAPLRILNLENKIDLSLLKRLLKNRKNNAQLSMIHNDELILFYCECMKEMDFYSHIFYLEAIDTLVIAIYEQEQLVLHDIFSEQVVDLNEIIAMLVQEKTQTVTLSFIPIHTEGYEIKEVEAHNHHLFILSKQPVSFNHMMFPILSNT